MITLYLVALSLAVTGLFASAVWDVRRNRKRSRPWYSMERVGDRR